MTRPCRLRLSRQKGFRLQTLSRKSNGLDCVIVARPSKWGNPFVIGQDGTRDQCVAQFSIWLNAPGQAAYRARAREHLQGRNLACWCPLEARCHADVLLALANADGN